MRQAILIACALLGTANGAVVSSIHVQPRLIMNRMHAHPAPIMRAKSAAEKLEAKGYWAGEWVCGDCGYIYEPGTEPPFEELRPFWKCPQCAGPRRRFVKKAGGMEGKLNDAPLFAGLAATAVVIIGLAYVGLTA